MSVRLRFRVGPFAFSDRLGRTQAEQRAAAKRHAARRQHRANQRAMRADPRELADHRENIAAVAVFNPRLKGLRTVTRADRRWLNSPEGLAAVQAVRDRDARRASGI